MARTASAACNSAGPLFAPAAPLPPDAALDQAVAELFDSYLDDADWRTQENANASRSVNGLNNYVREAFTKRYWLRKVYPEPIATAPRRRGLPPARPRVFRRLLRRLGPPPAPARRVHRRARQDRVPPRQTPALVPRPSGELHLHRRGRDCRRPGVVEHRYLRRPLHPLRQPQRRRAQADPAGVCLQPQRADASRVPVPLQQPHLRPPASGVAP